FGAPNRTRDSFKMKVCIFHKQEYKLGLPPSNYLFGFDLHVTLKNDVKSRIFQHNFVKIPPPPNNFSEGLLLFLCK
ncbi:hypothetical protein, partial [Salmonella sp. s55004]|uniref:hypothetical protein n=1 Tax=Salmonella sp. s55004 TaxID=3159675 RepID=UPI00397EE4C8